MELRSMEQKQAAVQMRDITKVFGTTVANDKVWLDIYRGEILALLGENGSGKTTLMNMLSGIYYPDGGQIFVDGKEVSIRSPKDAFDLGIGMIHQHFKLVDVLTAAENIVLGLKEPGRLDLNAAAKRIRAICDAYGFEVDPKQKIYDMSVSQKQTVEIVKVLYRGADILILDLVGDGDLAAVLTLLYYKGGQPAAPGVQAGGKPCGASSQHYYIVYFAHNKYSPCLIVAFMQSSAP